MALAGLNWLFEVLREVPCAQKITLRGNNRREFQDEEVEVGVKTCLWKCPNVFARRQIV